MSKDFSITTDSILLMLHALKTKLNNCGVRVGITKSNLLYPNAVAVVYVKNANRALYIVMDTRYSRSFNEYVIKDFKLVDFNSPSCSDEVEIIYHSSDYTYLIHEETFLNDMAKDIKNMIQTIKKEFGIC